MAAAAAGEPYTYDVKATDPDGGDALAYALTIAPEGMTIDASSGRISWTPVVTQIGARKIAVRVSDGYGGAATQIFTVAVSAPPANHPPTAEDDHYSVRRQQTLTAEAPGVLQNDSDPDGNSLLAQLVAGPLKGVLDLKPDGSFTYTPSEPPPGSNEPTLKFGFTDPDHVVTYTTSQPIVVDLDKDSVPEIVLVAWNSFLQRRLIALRGDTGEQVFSVDAYQPEGMPPFTLDQGIGLAAGDLDGDGFPEILAVNTKSDGSRSSILAFNHDGTLKWESQDVREDPLVGDVTGGGSGSFTTPIIANITGDAKPEIAIGYTGHGPNAPLTAKFVTVFDNQGQIVWTAQGSNPTPGSGAVLAADLDLDGNLEILFQNDLFDNQGNLRWSATDAGYFQFLIRDVAVANLDDDPFGEIVFLDNYNQLYVYEHTGVRKWGPVAALGIQQTAGLITIGDVDGDGVAEIVVVGTDSIGVVDRSGGSVRTIPLTYLAFAGNASIFDLNGDGKPEIMYNAIGGPSGTPGGDLIILDGATGAFLYGVSSPRISVGNNTGPIVADVDADGTAEIITGGSGGDLFLAHVFKAKVGPWAQARPVYNEFSYHVTNVNDDGTIPEHEAINWLTPGLNNYRINVPLPQERTGDKDQFTYKASDGQLDSNIATVRIDVLPPNHAPNILSQPPAVAAPSIEYLYAIRAVDLDAGEVLTFSLAQAPNGMTIDSASGLIRWTPGAEQTGRQLVAAKVTDSQGEFAYQGWAIDIVSAATVPDVVGQTQAIAQETLMGAGLVLGTTATAPSATAAAGEVISQEPAAAASVPAGSAVNLVISSGLQTASVPAVVGQAQAAAQGAISGIGLNIGRVTAAPSTAVPAGAVISQDPAGGTVVPLGTDVDLLVSIGTISLDGLASIVVEPAEPRILVGQNQAFVATGVFDDGTSRDLTGIVGWSSTADAIASISPVGVARGLTDGATTIEANVSGMSGSSTLTVRTRVAESTPPTAEITAPANDGEVTAPVDVVGTASDANFLEYRLEYAPAGEDAFTLLSQGTEPVTDGVLARFDPTMLINDQYTLRLTVADRGGNSAVASVNVQVMRNLKVGHFSLSFTDLSVAMSGLPITVNRVYDSRDKSAGDFGVGWRLELETLRIRTNRVLGTGWLRGQSGASITLFATDPHKVSVTLPSGEVEEFDMQVSPTSGLGSLDFTSVTGFTARPGTVGKLEALANNGLLIVNAGQGDELVDDGTLGTYDPQLFRYTSVDGTEFVVHRANGLQSLKDTNGNTLTFGPDGIAHSAGKSALFERDGEGRITRLTDPRGNVQTYAYDLNGDLASHTDAVGNTTQFFYDRNHNLIRTVDPLGRIAARSDYDDDGRLVSLTDAAGHKTTYQHDLASRQELVKDALGRVTINEYDERGNVLAVTDPLGARQTFTYDARDNRLTATDALGATTSYTYDAQNNLLSITDPLNRTTTFTRDSGGRPLTVTDSRGNTTAYHYDAQGNLLGSTDALGNDVSYSRDGAGNLTSLIDATGATSRNQYDPAGRRTQVIDALGTATSLQYDANGNLLSQQGQDGTPWGLAYDANNRIVGTSQGTVQRSVAYDAAGQISKVTIASGRELSVTFDAVGRPTAIESPEGGAFMQQSYDAVGNPTTLTDILGNQVTRTYDDANRLTSTQRPDGSTEQLFYDDAGRLTQAVDALGRSTRFGFDAAGELTSVTDALGGETTFEYDAAGNLSAQTDPAGHTTQFEYDALDRLVRTTYADGAIETRAYDVAGRLAQLTKAGGSATSYSYDAVGRLLSVTDAFGHITRHDYGGGAERSATTDANGNVTAFSYDAAGRLVRTTYPMGDSESTSYDATGHLLSRTNGEGETLQYQYDARGRLSGITLPDSSTETYTYTLDQLVSSITGARGTTTFDYDPLTRRLVRVTEPDGRYVRYAYDAVGNRTLVAHGDAGSELVATYMYDALNRLTEITDPGSGVTTQSYDAAGNVTSIARPNGVTTLITYDPRNRISSITDYDSGNAILASETYAVDALGNRTRVDRNDGSHVEYEYDALGRVTHERQVDGGSNVVFESTYAYDSAGNLVQTGPPASPVTYTYNANDQLIAGGGVSYTYDAAGRRVQETWTPAGGPTQSVQYGWDAKDRLASFRDSTGATTSYIYDPAGTRQGKGGASGPLDFLVDRRNDTGVSQILRESGADIDRSFVYGSRLLQTADGGATRYDLFNSLGSTRLLTSEAGVVTDGFDYQAYGAILSHSGSSGVPHRFAGEESDPESGLTYLRARYYDPRTGGFLSRDAFPGDASDPLSLHPYLYASGNPVNRTDPSGRFTIPEVLISSYERLQAQGQRILNIRRGLIKAKDAIADSMRATGGMLSVYALMEAVGNQDRVSRWFGFGKVSKDILPFISLLGGGTGAEGLAELGEAATQAIDLIAAVALTKTAIDMLGGRKVFFGIEGAGILLSEKIGDLKNNFTEDAEFSRKCKGSSAAAWGYLPGPGPNAAAGIELCTRFFTFPPLPDRSTLKTPGKASMAGLMVHEFAHISIRANDDAYNCVPFYFQPDPKSGKLSLKAGVQALKIIPGFGLFTADTYRCWVEDAAVSGGAAYVENDIAIPLRR